MSLYKELSDNLELKDAELMYALFRAKSRLLSRCIRLADRDNIYAANLILLAYNEAGNLTNSQREEAKRIIDFSNQKVRN